jgi:carboxylesterase
VLCHGLSGSPWSMRGWAEHLAAEGFAVSLPLLPGHGSTWQDLNNTRWPQWYATVEKAFLALRRDCDQVFVAGLSMGGALALRLAEHQPATAGLVLVNPSLITADKRFLLLPLLSRLMPSMRGITDDIAMPGVSEYGYDRLPLKALLSLTELWVDVRAGLSRVTQPILLFHSETDHVVDRGSARLLHQLTASADITDRPLHRSFHVATLDYDAKDIFAESVAFLRSHRNQPQRRDSSHD